MLFRSLKLLLQPVVRGLGCLYVPRPLGAVITITKIVADRIRPLAAFGHFLEG